MLLVGCYLETLQISLEENPKVKMGILDSGKTIEK